MIQNILFEKYKDVTLDLLGLSPITDSMGLQSKEALTLLVKAESRGYTFSKDLVHSLSNTATPVLTKFWKWFEECLGYNYMQPLYPNFPKEMLSLSEAQRVLNAQKHYWGDVTGVRTLPHTEVRVSTEFKEKNHLKLVGVTTSARTEDLFVQLLTSNVSISAADDVIVKELFESKIKSTGVIDKSITDAISQKEILALVGSLYAHNGLDFKELNFSTPTDLLRLCAAYCAGDKSLAAPTHFKSLPRKFRRDVLGVLNSQIEASADAPQLLEGMFTYREMWVRLAHALHSGEYAARYPLAHKFITDIRNNVRPETFNRQVELTLDAKDLAGCTALLSQRPGVFARKLQEIIKTFPTNHTLALDAFSKVSDYVATPVLLQLHNHFKYEKSTRVFMPKGGLGKIYEMDNTEPVKSPEVVRICEDTLVKRWSALDSLGAVYIDPELQKQNVAFAQRSASKTLKTVARGSRFTVEDKPIIRMFLWWNQTSKDKDVGRIDIDLSCILLDSDYQQLQVCTFYNLVGSGLTHSGDITSAPNGAAEFIDIELDKINPKTAYVAMVIGSYTQQKYADVPECYAGWMMREKAQAGEVFEPSSVAQKIDLTSESTQVMPAIYDAVKREFIWADLAITSGKMNTVGNNLSNLQHGIKGIVELRKPNLYDLFELHARARGHMVSTPEEADTVFSIKSGITPDMYEKISAEYLASDVPKPKPKP